MTEQPSTTVYPARVQIDPPEARNRWSTAFRLVLAVPILVVLAALSSSGTQTVYDESGDVVRATGGSITAGFFVATLLMLVFRQRYPRWWFDFVRELTRFSLRVGAYLALLTEEYPSTFEEQGVRVEIDYPDAERDLNRWLPLVKWLLAVPHYVVLFFLALGALAAIVVAWFAILFTGRYPPALFEYVVGVTRWGLRVEAYAEAPLG